MNLIDFVPIILNISEFTPDVLMWGEMGARPYSKIYGNDMWFLFLFFFAEVHGSECV